MEPGRSHEHPATDLDIYIRLLLHHIHIYDNNKGGEH